jgi:hypothetical protein
LAESAPHAEQHDRQVDARCGLFAPTDGLAARRISTNAAAERSALSALPWLIREKRFLTNPKWRQRAYALA